MSFISIGDLAQSFQLRRDTGRLKDETARLTTELSSGRVADTDRALRGDLRPLAALDRTVALLDRFRTAAGEALLLVETAQGALAAVEQGAETLSAAALLARTAASPAQVDAIGREGAQQFEAAVARLNVQAAGRTVFAGLATDGPALLGGAAMLDALETAVAGAATAADVASAVSAWFAPGGGFETAGYLGSADPLRPLPVSEGDPIAFDVTARDPAIAATLAGLAMAALLDRGVLSGQAEERRALAGTAGETLVSARDRLVSLRAEVGDAEAAISRAATRNAAERSAAEIARAALVAADPYEAAARLEAAAAQLETLYAVTARLSRLTLTDYLR